MYSTVVLVYVASEVEWDIKHKGSIVEEVTEGMTKKRQYFWPLRLRQKLPTIQIQSSTSAVAHKTMHILMEKTLREVRIANV